MIESISYPIKFNNLSLAIVKAEGERLWQLNSIHINVIKNYLLENKTNPKDYLPTMSKQQEKID